MSSKEQKQTLKILNNLMKIRKSLQIPAPLIEIILYQEKILLKISSFLQWCWVSFHTPNSNCLTSGFKKIYPQLSPQDQILYYEVSVKLAKELYAKKLERKVSSQDLPKYPWEMEYLTHQQPKLEKGFFDKTTVFYKSEWQRGKMHIDESKKVYLQVVSAQGHYVEMKRILNERNSYLQKKQSLKNQILSPRKDPKSKTIIIDLRQFVFHRQKNPDDEKFNLFLLTKFTKPNQTRDNNLISNDDGIQQIYFDIRHYYKYKQRMFIDFYFYSYREYLRGILEFKSFKDVEIVLRTKNSQETNKNNLFTSIEFLNDFNNNEIDSERKLVDLNACQQNIHYQNENYLSVRHINEPIDLTTSPSQQLYYLKNIHSKNKRYQKLWIDWKKDSSNIWTYVNQDKLSAQRGVVKHILKTILAYVFSGKSVFSTSLPVTIFENVSLVEKICSCLGYAPLAFRQISSNPLKADSIHAQIKSVMIIMIGFSILYIQEMAKPFNSVLGETFQGVIDGCPVYAEQISHHPPITAFFMKGKGFYMYGSLEPIVSFGINKIVGSNKGFVSVVFDDQNVMSFTFPDTEMGGLIMGERTIKRTGESYILCQSKKMFGKVQWGPKHEVKQVKGSTDSVCKRADPSKEDYLHGKFYKIHDKTLFSHENYKKITESDYQQQISSIEGNWTSSLFIDNVHEFDFQSQLPFCCIQHLYPLSSHSNLRQDIKFKRLNEIDKSEQEKQNIEMVQRNDRVLRRNYSHNKDLY